MSFGMTLYHFFVPHHTNNHRSKALHINTLLVYVLAFAIFNYGLGFVHRQMPDVLGYATDIHVQQLLDGTNAQRAAAGLSPLTLNSELSVAAANKAQDMFAKDYWAHNSPAGQTPWDFISGAGYRYVLAGENLAKNFSTSQAVVDAWMASPSHRANIVKPNYKDIGFAVVNGKLNGEDTTLVVQMFGTSVDSLAEAPAPTKAPVVIDQAVSTQQAPQVAEALPTQAPAALASAQQSLGSEFSGVTRTPAINIPTLTRYIVFVFAGVLLGVLAIDAWVVSRRKIVRVAGHNIAHFLFLSAIVILAGITARGSLL